MRLTHLHAHTTFSFLDGYGTPDQLAERMQELGHDACAITDHGNIIGHVPFARVYSKKGIKPIFGCEFYICDDMSLKDKVHAPSTNSNGLPHITVLAQTQKGYSNLLKLSRMSYEQGQYYKPRIDHNALIENQEGLIVLSGCPTGYPTRFIQNKPEGLIPHLQWLKSRIQNYYIEIVPQPDWDVSIGVSPVLWNAACQLGIPVVFTSDCHFPRPEDWFIEDALLAVGLGENVHIKERKLQLPKYQYYCSAEELLDRAVKVLPGVQLEYLQQGVDNSYLIGQTCNVELQKATPVSFPGIPENKTSADYLWDLIGEGFVKKLQHGEIPVVQQEIYFNRAIKEFITLREKGFCDYILAISDVISWMKNQNYLIMTRGSAGGCLLLWLLGSSVTDPIKYGLSFERFYDDTREDPPDVDIDFEQTYREIAIDYIYNKYGQSNCSQIAALSQLKPRGAIQDACSALNIHRTTYSCLSDAVDDKDMDMERQLNSVKDPAAIDLLNKYPTLRKLIIGMTGQYRHSSVHAAGVLVSSSPLEEVIGVIVSNNKTVAAIDKAGAEFLGFLKIDMLSVQALDVIGNIVRKINGGDMRLLYMLPMDDPNVFATAKKGLMTGIFQLDGASASKALKEIGADDFRDLVAASVLCRPGANIYTPTYAKNKTNNDEFMRYLAGMHPIAAEIVKETYGVLMYQEQVMRMARELAGLEWKLVHRLRREVGKKLGLDPQKGDAWRAEWYNIFVNGCVKNGVSQQEAEHWWEVIQHHGGYSFNKSHALTYGVMSYWMLYLKTYYPAFFYESYLSFENDDAVKKKLVREFMDIGGNVLFLHSKSGKTFSSLDSSTLIGGYSDLKYVGPAAAVKIEEANPCSWDELLAIAPKRTRELIQQSGLLTGLYNPAKIIELVPWLPLPGLSQSDYDIRREYNTPTVKQITSKDKTDGDITVIGYVTQTKFDKDRVIFTVEDETDFMLVRVATKQLRDLGSKVRELKEGDLVAVKGWWAGEIMFLRAYVTLRKKQ